MMALKLRSILPAAALAMVAVTIPAVAGDVLYIDARTLDRGGASLLTILPDGRLLESRTITELCTKAMVSPGEVLALDLDQNTCKTCTAVLLDGLVLSWNGLPEFDSVTQCLAAHFAALEDDSSGLTTCFAWFECADLATTISGPDVMCAGESIVLDAGLGYESYLWSPGGQTARTITVGPLIDTLFEVEVQDEWGCHGFDDHQVVVAPAPLPSIAGPAGICAGASAILDAGEGWDSYLWSPGGEMTRTILVAPVSDTAYSVRVTDGAGCPGTSADHLLEVWQLPEPLILGPSRVVLGYSVILDAGAGYVSYLWSTNETLRMIEVSPVENTIYSVNVTDPNDCSATSPEHLLEVVPADVFHDGFEFGDTSGWSSSTG